MPARSSAQFRAMEAAKGGNSKLGIPQKVGAEYAAETPDPGSLPPKAKPPTVKKKGSPMAMAMQKAKGGY